MRILYGVQTTGHGHLVRARAMIPALKELGHQVDIVLSGPTPNREWKTRVFDRFTHYRGFTFVTNAGRVRYAHTAMQLRFRRFFRDVRGFDARGVDLVITDYEPVTAYIALLRGIPSVGVGHLYAYCHRNAPVAGINPVGRLVTRYFAPVKHPLGLHWHHFNEPILPPTIPHDVCNAETIKEDKVLVYLPFENPRQAVSFLAPFKGYEFHVYTDADIPSPNGHIFLHPLSRSGFQKDLGECAGVLTNAGFSLTSEALHLGKKVLVKPVAGQIEQLSNAAALRKLNLGSVMETYDAGVFSQWLDQPPAAAMNYPDVTSELARWIDRGDLGAVDDLVARTWSGSGVSLGCLEETGH